MQYVLMLILLFQGIISALPPSIEPSQFTSKQFKNDIVGQVAVYDVVQDERGLLLIAGAPGVMVYDGYQFTRLHIKDSSATELFQTGVHSILTDKNTYWLGTFGRGIGKYNIQDKTISYISEKDGLYNNYVRKLVTYKNNIYAVFENGGMCILSGSKVKKCVLKDIKLYDIDYDDTSIIVSGDMGKLYRVYENRVEEIPNPIKASILSVNVDHLKNLWIGTNRSGLFLKRKNQKTFQKIKNDALDKSEIKTIYEDRNNTLWIGRNKSATLRFIWKNNKLIKYNSSIPAKYVNSFLEDIEGNLWIASVTGTLTQLFTPKVITLGTESGLPRKHIFPLIEYKNKFFIGTLGGGVYAFNSKQNQFIRHNFKKLELSNFNTNTMYVDGKDLWLGTRNNGVFHIRNNVVKSSYDSNFLPTTQVTSAILKDSRKNIWIGSFINGVGIIYHDGTTRHFTEKDGFTAKVVTGIRERKDGAIFISTVSSGLYKYFNNKFTNFNRKSGLNEDIVLSIYLDHKDRIWVTTRNGINLILPDDTIERIKNPPGLNIFDTYATIQDQNNDFWIASSNGLLKIPHEEIDIVLDGKKRSPDIEHFGSESGLKNSDFNGGTHYPAISRSDGTLAFANADGLVVIDPNNIRKNTYSAPIIISKIVIDGENIAIQNQSTFKSFKSLELHFALLSFQNKNEIKYRYKLEGFDDTWIHTGNRNIAYYTNIPPGTYTFKVKGINADGVSSKNTAFYTFTREPLYYETVWFKLILLLLLVALIYSFFKTRNALLKKRNKELREQVKQRTHELELLHKDLVKNTIELEIANNDLKEISLKDTLTGLWNRRYLHQIVLQDLETVVHSRKRIYTKEEEKRNHKKNAMFGMLLIDLDHFKKINDKYGHISGDMVLQQLADIFKNTLRRDDVITRWGGEEFLIILKHIKPHHLFNIAEKIRIAVMSHEFAIDGNNPPIHCTCSMGCIPFPFYDKEYADIFSFDQSTILCDSLLYYAKEHGRNRSIRLKPLKPPETKAVLESMLHNLHYGVERGYYELITTTEQNFELNDTDVSII